MNHNYRHIMKAVPGGHNLFIQVRNWFTFFEVFTFVHVLTFLIL